MKYLSPPNTKLSRSNVKTLSFGLPAYKSISGFIVCTGAKECIGPCYARQGAYTWEPAINKRERNLEASKRADFPEIMVEEIILSCADRIRLHDSGDFYSREYLHKWLTIIDALPHVEFYCYTKSEYLFIDHSILPDNFKVCFSYGGKHDSLIDPKIHRHSKVFPNLGALKKAGYVDASVNDDNCLGDNHKIGLIYHGAKSKTKTLGV